MNSSDNGIYRGIKVSKWEGEYYANNQRLKHKTSVIGRASERKLP